MAERHQHLRITRAEPVNPRRTKPGFSPKPPEDPRGHAVLLGNALDETLGKPEREPGFDPRRCLKLQVDGIDPSQLEAIGGLELVSQEGRTLVVLFASEEGLREFRSRLTILARGGREEGVGYLQKPFTQATLARKVREVLNEVLRPQAG